MASNKIQRINQDIQITLSELLRNIKDPRVRQGLLSVTAVDTTADLRYAKVFVSCFGKVDEKELKKGLNSAAGYLRKELGQKLSIRYTPELLFEVDSSIAYGAHINKIISDLNKDGETDKG